MLGLLPDNYRATHFVNLGMVYVMAFTSLVLITVFCTPLFATAGGLAAHTEGHGHLVLDGAVLGAALGPALLAAAWLLAGGAGVVGAGTIAGLLALGWWTWG